jgi:hypothetical protein
MAEQAQLPDEILIDMLRAQYGLSAGSESAPAVYRHGEP